MNLRSFHALLIFLAAALAALFGVWCLNRFGQWGGGLTLLAAIVAFAASAGLVVYDRWFLQRTKALR